MSVLVDDRFPASVTCPDGSTLPRAKACLTERDGDAPGRLLIATAAGTWLHDVPWDPEASSVGHRMPWTVNTDAGVFEVGVPSGCRCGRLGHWQPFGGPERRRVGARRSA